MSVTFAGDVDEVTEFGLLMPGADGRTWMVTAADATLVCPPLDCFAVIVREPTRKLSTVNELDRFPEPSTGVPPWNGLVPSKSETVAPGTPVPLKLKLLPVLFTAVVGETVSVGGASAALIVMRAVSDGSNTSFVPRSCAP